MNQSKKGEKSSVSNVTALLKSKGICVNSETVEEILKMLDADENDSAGVISLEEDELEPISGGIRLNMFETADGEQIAVLDTEDHGR